MKKTVASLFTAAGVVAVSAFAWGGLIERNRFTIQEHELPILPKGSPDFRILHISDLHLAPWQTEKIKWISALQALQPDLIINTGDNFGHRDGLPALKKALGSFSHTPGVYVYGSNDYFGPQPKNPFSYFWAGRPKRPSERLDIDGLTEFFDEDLGWINLNNRAAIIDVGDLRIEFLGVNDPHIHQDSTVDATVALEQVRENLSDDDAVNEILTFGITHAPYKRVLNAFTTAGADIIFAGHTHGGQVRIPGLDAAPVTNCDIPGQYARGLHLWPHARRFSYLNVSAGLGTSIYAPVRFACPPEVSFITLTAES